MLLHRGLYPTGILSCDFIGRGFCWLSSKLSESSINGLETSPGRDFCYLRYWWLSGQQVAPSYVRKLVANSSPTPLHEVTHPAKPAAPQAPL